MPKECSSCKNGSGMPDWAVYKVVKAPMEARKIHGLSLCECHADVLLEQYPEAEIQEVPEWVNEVKNFKE